MMNVTYIAHSGFAVETEHQVLLFDYAQGELPKLSPEKPWYVFASHVHGDHFSEEIFRLAQKQERIYSILSSDIPEEKVEDRRKNHVIFMAPWEKIMVDGMWVETLKSTDEGVAFVVTLEDGTAIYHAGDLNDWFWEGEDASWNRKMEECYDKVLEKIRGRHFHIAFVPVDPRLGSRACDGAVHLLQRVTADVLFPMHCWEQYGVIAALKEKLEQENFGGRIADISGRGQVFQV